MPELSSDNRAAIWEALDRISRRHRAFPGTGWTLPSSELDRVEAIAADFRPHDSIANIRFLFDEQLPDIGVSRSGDFAGYQVALHDARLEGVRKLIEAEGLGGAYGLADAAKDPFLVGWAVAEAQSNISEDAVLGDLDSENDRRRAFALGYVRERASSGGIGWIEATLPRLSDRPLAQARILLGASNEFHTIWQKAGELGREVEEEYWKEFVPFGLGTDFPLASEAARHLIEHGRPAPATDLLSMYTERDDAGIDAGLIAEVLDALITSSPQEQGRVSAYEIQRLLDHLRSSTIDEDQLAVLEWRLLPALGYDAPAPILEKRLARDPSFFVELLSMCFKRADGEVDKDAGKDAAQNAFRLLRGWRVVPGSARRDGEVDEAQLNSWLNEALTLLTDAGRVEVGCLYIGHILAYAKSDADGLWPTAPVRNAIERLSNEAVERGFRTETYGKRGVTSRGLADGGKQEYELAAHFDRLAGLVSLRWPRTGAMLRSIAGGYQAQGRAEDEEARRFIEGLD